MARKKTTQKKATKKVAKKPVPRKPARKKTTKKSPAKQGKPRKSTAVGRGRPPVEHQFQPGQSGNPAGPPKARSNLWRHFCKWLEMTPDELKTEKRRRDLTMSERAALKQAEQLVRKGLAGTAWLATREAWSRDEGKPTEHVHVTGEHVLSDEECDEIRKAMGGD
jgi:hypothetical protein